MSSGTSVNSSTAITTSSTSAIGGKTSTTKTSSSQVSSAANTVSSGTSGTATGGVGPSATNTGNGASNVVQNIPLVSSYMPTFYGQSYLPFEDVQLVQPRMAYYYDQATPTSLARSDGTTPNLAYPTMSADGRFARTDNNSSPVQSQQTGSSVQMNIPPYAYFYGTNVVPGSFQQFTPQIYSVSSRERKLLELLKL